MGGHVYNIHYYTKHVRYVSISQEQERAKVEVGLRDLKSWFITLLGKHD